MLDRFFGEGFFLFLAFQDCWAEMDLCAWIPFLILLLILCECGDGFDGGCGC